MLDAETEFYNDPEKDGQRLIEGPADAAVAEFNRKI